MTKNKSLFHDNAAYSVLRLSVTRLMHIRDVQATDGGHFAQVARELGYARGTRTAREHTAELRLLEAQVAADQARRRRSDALIQRLNAARQRLGVASVPPITPGK